MACAIGVAVATAILVFSSCFAPPVELMLEDTDTTLRTISEDNAVTFTYMAHSYTSRHLLQMTTMNLCVTLEDSFYSLLVSLMAFLFLQDVGEYFVQVWLRRIMSILEACIDQEMDRPKHLL